MRRHRLDVETVGKGTECGLTLEGWRDFKPGDLIQCIRKARSATRVSSLRVALLFACWLLLLAGGGEVWAGVNGKSGLF